MKKFTIKKELIEQYVKREVSKKMKMTALIFLLFSIFMFVFSYSYGVHNFIIPPLVVMFLIILVAIYFASSTQIKEIINYTTFIVSEDAISKFLEDENLNLINKFSVDRIEKKYGQKFDQTIKFSEIDYTKIVDNEIVIKSINYDLITSNGKIAIPKEMEYFEDFKNEVMNNSEKFKLFSPNNY